MVRLRCYIVPFRQCLGGSHDIEIL
ncbi:hypothetical protein PENSTE_c045G07066 [Penicillium steckii]|uniref:Uncharacterized protein n=1 Tax=Penicillium steckii TaxID=303698 RepID=A0A1V6SI91_9EURO|nr:hypothetical protein PENSTE_c045G07066 [Penicillium steckii]